MATFNAQYQTVNYLLLRLLLLASVVLFSYALINHQVPSAHRLHRRVRSLIILKSTASPKKSPESNFWIAIANTSSSSNGIPAIHRLDHETGPLPPGAYRSANSDDGNDSGSPCMIAVGIQPPLNADDGEDVWMEGVKNCQKLIDSGFNTFRVNNCYKKDRVIRRKARSKRRTSPSSIALENMKQRTLQTEMRYQAEANFYNSLRKCTPPSVLRSCHFMVNLEMPSVLSEESVVLGASENSSSVPYGNGWMVRESVSNALLRTKGECLDSVVMEYHKNSPYHLDALDTLFEMKRDGIIQSISTKNFPPSLLRSAFDCGFNVYSNDVYGNLMNTNNIQTKSELVVLGNDYGCSHLISAPLGGGIFTNQYCQFQELAQLSSSSKKKFNNLLDSCCKFSEAGLDDQCKWKKYRAIMDAVADISFKHQVSVESIALRWMLQLSGGNNISVGTQMGMDFVEEQGGKPYSRHRDLRQVFSYSLEEDDMERLCQVAGFNSDRNDPSGMTGDHEIDFTNRALWI